MLLLVVLPRCVGLRFGGLSKVEIGVQPEVIHVLRERERIDKSEAIERRRLRDHLRPVDLVARIGGEEFLVALPDAPLGLAQIAAERLCRVVQERPVLVAGGPMVNVTLSIGLAIGGGTGSSAHFGVQALIDRADHAMLEAKADGRNQVIISKNAA